MYLSYRYLLLPFRSTYFPSQEIPSDLGTSLERTTSQIDSSIKGESPCLG
jgi:hypothetical protein